MKISVLLISYNQGAYIAQALDSILMQLTNQPFEIIVGDDCSTDGTQDILRQYQARFPQIIRLHLQERNTGGYTNFKTAYNAATGEYMAYLEGDDYWISPYKLHRQMTTLDNNPDLAACFHNYIKIYTQDCKMPELSYGTVMRNRITISELLTGNFIHTSAVMFRRALTPQLPDWFEGLALGDWPLHVLNAQFGDFAYMPDAMSAYRIHPGSAWSTAKRVDQLLKSLIVAEAIDEHIDRKHHALLCYTRANWHTEAAELLLAEGKHPQARNCLDKALILFKESGITPGTPLPATGG